jgi:hypothetical protein
MYKSVTYNSRENTYIFNCPHCDALIEVCQNQTNCLIFRHGSLKENNTQIDPHLGKEECDRLFNENLIYGCGKPFKLVRNGTNEIDKVVVCDYI